MEQRWSLLSAWTITLVTESPEHWIVVEFFNRETSLEQEVIVPFPESILMSTSSLDKCPRVIEMARMLKLPSRSTDHQLDLAESVSAQLGMDNTAFWAVDCPLDCSAGLFWATSIAQIGTLPDHLPSDWQVLSSGPIRSYPKAQLYLATVPSGYGPGWAKMTWQFSGTSGWRQKVLELLCTGTLQRLDWKSNRNKKELVNESHVTGVIIGSWIGHLCGIWKSREIIAKSKNHENEVCKTLIETSSKNYPEHWLIWVVNSAGNSCQIFLKRKMKKCEMKPGPRSLKETRLLQQLKNLSKTVVCGQTGLVGWIDHCVSVRQSSLGSWPNKHIPSRFSPLTPIIRSYPSFDKLRNYNHDEERQNREPLLIAVAGKSSELFWKWAPIESSFPETKDHLFRRVSIFSARFYPYPSSTEPLMKTNSLRNGPLTANDMSANVLTTSEAAD